MPSVSHFVDEIDGVREGVADAIATRYDSIEALADARKVDLQEIKGVGPVLATRILESARAATTSGPTAVVDELSERTRTAIADAADAARPVLDVVQDAARDTARDEPTTEPAAEPELPPAVVRVATWVGTSVGWSIRAYRIVTSRLPRRLHRA